MDAVDIPPGPESEDEEEGDEEGASEVVGNFTVDESGEPNIDYLDIAQEIDIVDELPVRLDEIITYQQFLDTNDEILEENDVVEVISEEPIDVPGAVKSDINNVDLEPCVHEPNDDLDNQALSKRLYKTGIKWYKKYHKHNQKFNFSENFGPKIVTETPIDSFNTLFSDELVEMLVVQTNIYATQKALGPIRFPTNSKEMRVFLGLNLCMGIKKLLYYRDYWSAQPELRDSYNISKHMSENRFGWLLTHLHVNDNSAMPNRGKCDRCLIHFQKHIKTAITLPENNLWMKV